MKPCDALAGYLPLAPDDIADAAVRGALQQHLQSCPACRARRAVFAQVQSALARAAARYPAPAALRQAISAGIAATPPQMPRARSVRVPAERRPAWWWAGLGAGWIAAAIMASVLVLPAAPRLAAPQRPLATLAFIDNHARALVTEHLIDVASVDRHTVKPWFRGRLDYAPPVLDLAAAGFPLGGGRLEVLDRQRIAVLVYQRRQHAIAVYVWPQAGAAPVAPALAETDALGYRAVQWQAGGMRFVAVSDLDRPELLAMAQAYWQGLQADE